MRRMWNKMKEMMVQVPCKAQGRCKMFLVGAMTPLIFSSSGCIQAPWPCSWWMLLGCKDFLFFFFAFPRNAANYEWMSLGIGSVFPFKSGSFSVVHGWPAHPCWWSRWRHGALQHPANHHGSLNCTPVTDNAITLPNATKQRVKSLLCHQICRNPIIFSFIYDFTWQFYEPNIVIVLMVLYSNKMEGYIKKEGL